MSHSQLGGDSGPESWEVVHKLGDQNDVITVEVNNVLTEKKINNVFGVIKGFVDSGTVSVDLTRDVLLSRFWCSEKE